MTSESDGYLAEVDSEAENAFIAGLWNSSTLTLGWGVL